MVPDNDFEGMDDLAEETARQTDALLADQELAILKKTSTNLKSFRIAISDKASFDKLISATNASTKNNESVGQLRDRIRQLGGGVVAVAKQVVVLASKTVI
jgi:hypothetical protein